VTLFLLRHTSAILLALVAFGFVACGGESLPLANAGKLGLQARTVDDLLMLAPEEIDIGTAGLVFSHELDPEVDIEGLQNSLDILAGWLRDRITPEMNAEQQAVLLIQLIYHERIYRSADDPWGPGAHDLGKMMFSKRGNCMGLTSLYLALGERAGLEVNAMLAPRHVYAVLMSGEDKVFIEPTEASYSVEGPPGALWFDSEWQRDGDLYGQPASASAMLAQMILSHSIELMRLGDEEASDEYERRAVELARHAISLDPGLPSLWVNLELALARLSIKQDVDTEEEQRQCLAKARAIVPGRAEYWARSAEFENRYDHWQKAVNYSERAIRLEPNMPTHYLPLSIALWGQEEYELAAQALHRSRELQWTQIHPARRSHLSELFEDENAFDVQALRVLAEIYGDAADDVMGPDWDEENHTQERHAALIAQKTPRSLSATCLVLSELTRTGDVEQAKKYLLLFGTDGSEDAASADLRRLRKEVRERLAHLESQAAHESPAGSPESSEN
jgi:regulator of sirC expression with transglutaminase-like and TPR domain